MSDKTKKKGLLDVIFGDGTADKINGFIDDAYNKTADFFNDFFPKVSVENPKFDEIADGWNNFREKFWGDLWEDVVFPANNESTKTKSNAAQRGNEARNYIIGFTNPKTFDAWLSDLGLSRDENSEKYFGSYFKNATKSLLDSAYSDKAYNIASAKQSLFEKNLAAGNAYELSQSDFNNKAQTLYKKGLKNSGFDSYLKGIAYLGYRDEIAKNNTAYENSVMEYNKVYADKEAELKSEMSEKIAKREAELLKLYKDEKSDNNKLLGSLT